MDRRLVLVVAEAIRTQVEGRFQRHMSVGHRTLTGSAGGGRWGPAGVYPVLYLGRPTDSVIVEAYRHLVEPVAGMRPDLVVPRRLIECEVSVSNILDLRGEESQRSIGLNPDDLFSDVGDHGACQRVGQAAHQLGLHGILAPAATGLGETLALFERRLPPDEQPVLLNEVIWNQLPADPRELRAVNDH